MLIAEQSSITDQQHRILCCWAYRVNRHLHAGLSYRIDDTGAVAHLHLAWEDQVSAEPPTRPFEVEPDADTAVLTTCARLCAVIERRYRDQTFPYAMGMRGSHFRKTGDLALGHGANGLTCASFVLAVLRSVAIEVVNESTWPVRKSDDLMWAETFKDSPPMYNRLRADIDAGSIRVRPAEMVAAVETAKYPVEFTECDARAREIERDFGL